MSTQLFLYRPEELGQSRLVLAVSDRSDQLMRLPSRNYIALGLVLKSVIIAILLLVSDRAWCQPQREGGIARLVPQVGHGGFIESVSMTRDGKFIVTGGWDGTARLWHAETGVEVGKILSERGGSSTTIVTAICSPTEDRVALTDNYKIKLYDLRDSHVVWTNDLNMYDQSGVSFAQDGRRLLCTSGAAVESNSSAKVHLLDANSGEIIRSINLPGKGQFARPIAAVSPDGDRIATSFRAGVDHPLPLAIWSAETGQLIDRRAGPSNGVATLTFSADGKLLLGVGNDGAAYIWAISNSEAPRRVEPDTPRTKFCAGVFLDGASKAALVEFQSRENSPRTGQYFLRVLDTSNGVSLKRVPHGGIYPDPVLALTPDKRNLLSVLESRAVKAWDVSTLNSKVILEGRGNGSAEPIQLSLDEKRALVRFRGEPYSPFGIILDLETGRVLRRVTNGLGFAMSRDGSLAIQGHTIINIDSGKILATCNWWVPADFTPDARFVLAEGYNRQIELWDVVTGGVSNRFTLPADVGDSSQVLAVTHDLQSVASAGINSNPDGKYDMTVRLWRLSSGELIRRLQHDQGWVNSLQFTSDGRQLLICGQKASKWDVETGQRVLLFEDKDHPYRLSSANGAQFTADEQCVVTWHDSGMAAVWDAKTGQLKEVFGSHSGACGGALFASKRGLVISGGRDGEVKFWRYAPKQELMSYFYFKDQSWAVVDSAGRFDASSTDIGGLYWAVGSEPVALGQLKARYFDPGLFNKHFGSDRKEYTLKEVNAFNTPRLYPELQAEADSGDSKHLNVKLKNRGGGIGRVVVKINGKEFTADARPEGSDPTASELSLTLDLQNDPRMQRGVTNEIELLAYNQEEYLQSRGKRVYLKPEGDEEVSASHVWAVVAGVSHYRNDAINLRYAAKDADDFSTALRVASGRLFGADKVHITLLSSHEQRFSAGDSVRQPTKRNLLNALNALATNVGPRDIVVVYLSGHGVDRGKSDNQFYYLSAEAEGLDLADPEVRANVALSSGELAEALRATRSTRQVVILDTCGAGKALDRLGQKREVQLSSRRRALEEVKDKSGVFILAGCAADAPSYEASRFAQGILTHTLLLGMRRDQPAINVMDLFRFAVDRVPHLAKGVGGVQQPEMASPGGSGFPLGQVIPADQSRIPLNPAIPVVVSAKFEDELEWTDILGLSGRIDERLRDLDASAAASILFIDDRSFPDAYCPVARYQIMDDIVKVDLRLINGDKSVAKFSVQGNTNQLDLLADQILKEIQERVPRSTTHEF